MAEVRFLLWDFGDTLVDEQFLRRNPDGVPDWADVLNDLVDGELGRRWDTGTASTAELEAQLSARLAMTPEAVHAHVIDCCRDIRFFDHAWAAARSRALPQAIVTVNPDLFRDLIVASYGLTDVFDTIVTSAEAGTESKAELCEIAARRLGCDDRAEILLIDNIEANVDAWRARGGRAYWFRGDDEFAVRFSAGGWNALQ